MDLICVGDVMLDVRADAGRLATGGDVHGRVMLRPGGTSANAAVWAVAAGASAAVVGAVGDDLAGELLTRELAARGVDTGWIRPRHAPTGMMLVAVEAGERSMVADRGANALLAPDELPPLEAGAVLVSGYLLLQEPGHEVALAALAEARTGLLAVEAVSWPLVETFGAERFFAATVAATVVLANDEEAHALTGLRGAEAARVLGDRYRVAAVKQGAAGAALSVDARLCEEPGTPVEERDPTGAGDAFDGVLLAGLARGQEPGAALAAACRAGARVAASYESWPEPDDPEEASE